MLTDDNRDDANWSFESSQSFEYGQNLTKVSFTDVSLGQDNYYVLEDEEIKGYSVFNGKISRLNTSDARIMNGVAHYYYYGGFLETTYGVVGVLEDIYAIGHDDTKIIQKYVEERDQNGFYHFYFENYGESYDGSAYLSIYECKFTYEKNDGYISYLSVNSKHYTNGIIFNANTGLYELEPGTQYSESLTTTFNQVAGERTASLPFDPTTLYITSFDLIDNDGNPIGDHIDLTTDFNTGSKKFTLTNMSPSTFNLSFNSFMFEIVNGGGYGVNAFCSNDGVVTFYGSKGGEYTVRYGFKNVMKELTITASYIDATSINAICNKPTEGGYAGNYVKNSEINLYVDEEVIFRCEVKPSGADPSVTWSIEEASGFEGGPTMFYESNRFAFKGLTVGDFHLTAVSTTCPSVSNYGDVTITVDEESKQMARWSIEFGIEGYYFYQDADARMKYSLTLIYWTADYQNLDYNAISTDYSVYVSSSASGWSAIALDDGTYKIVPSGHSYGTDDNSHFGGANRIDDRLGDIIYDPATESISLTICGSDGTTPIRLTLSRNGY